MIKFSASLAEINMLNKLRELRLGAERKEREKRFYDYERRKNKNNFLTVKLELTPSRMSIALLMAHTMRD
jgi:hypothetical protein